MGFFFLGGGGGRFIPSFLEVWKVLAPQAVCFNTHQGVKYHILPPVLIFAYIYAHSSVRVLYGKFSSILVHINRSFN